MEHRFTLEKYSGPASRHTCPSCGKLKKFTRYIDIETGLAVADHVGRCDREVECGYHYKPGEYYKDNPINRPSALEVKIFNPRNDLRLTQLSYIPSDIMQKSISSKGDHFTQFLANRFGSFVVSEIAKRYSIGTSKHWSGATVFWQIDSQNKVRTGKVMLYNANTGKRVKCPYDHVTWAHSILCKKKLIPEPFNLDQCLFGENQINSSNVKEVVIVESEKTAIISSIYFPEYTWMACGGLSMLSLPRIKALKRYPIILYPDLKALNKWQAKAKEFCANGFRVTVSGLLENVATMAERDAGHDLADYLLKMAPPKSKLQCLIQKNPYVQNLIDRFELTEV